MFSITIYRLPSLQSKDVEACRFKTTVCFEYNDKKANKPKLQYVQNILISPDRSWKLSEKDTLLAYTVSFIVKK